MLEILEDQPFWIKGGKAVSGKLSGSNCLSTLPASLPFHSSTGFIFSFRWSCTCVNSSIEIPLSLQCKILQYKIIWQLPMEVQDFFYLCKIYHPAWIQVDRRNVEQSGLWLFRPLYNKTENTPSNVKSVFDKYILGYQLNLVKIKIDLTVFFCS